jgi:hypothetical protein
MTRYPYLEEDQATDTAQHFPANIMKLEAQLMVTMRTRMMFFLFLPPEPFMRQPSVHSDVAF